MMKLRLRKGYAYQLRSGKDNLGVSPRAKDPSTNVANGNAGSWNVDRAVVYS